MNTRTLLIVEDDADIRELLRFNLAREGFVVLEAEDGSKGLELAKKHLPCLVILDVMLPNMNGFDVCRSLRADTTTASIPVLVLTALGEEMDRVVGLSLGADDYVVKPFSMRELILRVKAILRRLTPKESDIEKDTISRHGIELDRLAHKVSVNGQFVQLTSTEFNLLEDLMRHVGVVRTREQLLDSVWGYSFEGYARTVDTHVRRLRGKLSPLEDLLETVRGVGYRFKD